MNNDAPKPSDQFGTPQVFFDKWNLLYNFTLDAAATLENSKCDTFYTFENSGLVGTWENEIVWCNPPYSNLKPWIIKARKESLVNNATVVMFIPVNTSDSMFNICFTAKEIHFVQGRIKFVGGADMARFSNMVVIFDNIIHEKPEFFQTSRGLDQEELF